MSDYLLWATITITAFCGLMLWRNELVFRYRMRAASVASNRSKRSIDSGDWKSWEREWGEYEKTEYGRQLWDFRKWTFRQFFPSYAGEQDA